MAILTHTEILRLNELVRVLVNTRNMLRAGANGNSRVVNSANSPTLLQTLDAECIKLENFLASVMTDQSNPYRQMRSGGRYT
jgi:hypothetical protein